MSAYVPQKKTGKEVFLVASFIIFKNFKHLSAKDWLNVDKQTGIFI